MSIYGIAYRGEQLLATDNIEHVCQFLLDLGWRPAAIMRALRLWLDCGRAPLGGAAAWAKIRAERRQRGFTFAAIGKQVGLTRAAVSQWRHVPAKYCRDVAKLLGLTPHDLRPDVYPDVNYD